MKQIFEAYSLKEGYVLPTWFGDEKSNGNRLKVMD
jgi:hypothetical protein